MTYRVRNIAIAVGLALVAAMLTLFYVTNYKRSVQQGESQVHVWVAAHDVVAGRSGAELAKNHAFKQVEVAKRSVVPGAISNPDEVSRLVLSQPLFAGEQVTLRRFTDVQAQGIRAQLKGTMRAFQMAGDPNQLLAGTLKPGDHVDVVSNLNLATTGTANAHVDRIVLRDLLVLQVGSTPGTARVDANAQGSIVLAVTDTQVQKLFFVLKNTDWSLELRPVVDAADSSERLENIHTVLHDGLSQAAWNRVLMGGN
jgi:Flp pilus assembly protein CpaB